MKNANEKASFSTTCPKCGHELPAGTKVCPGCGAPSASEELASDAWSVWERARKTLKTQWVASVIAFWVSAAVLGVVFTIENKLNLILVSIVLGMLVIGMWLKTRYQLHLRKEPVRQSENVRAD
jgi:uncharacterized OB-fold protein